MNPQKVLIIGGGGFYGRYLVNDLYQFSQAEIVVAGRTPPPHWPGREDRIRSLVCDLNDLAALTKAVAPCQLVIHCAGPFHTLPLNPLHAAIATGADYVDIAEDRHYWRAVQALAQPIEQAKIAVYAGMSVAPAMEALFAQMLTNCFEQMLSIRTFAAPDTRKHRGQAMFQTMLTGVGRPFWQPGNGRLRQVHGWTEPEWVQFPPPIGKRLTYLVLEMADLDLLPQLFKVQTVEFKAGTEWPFLNRLLGLAARIRATAGRPAWERFTKLVRAISWLAGRFGKDEGGVIFEIGGLWQGVPHTHRLAVVTGRDGGLIPSILASIVASKILDGSLSQKGLVPVQQWIRPPDLIAQFQARGLELWWQAHQASHWQPFSLAELQKYQIR